MQTISENRNGFDVLRVLLSVGVVYSHSYHVGGFGPEPLARLSKEGVMLGWLCVMGFFGLSGFLVGSSFAKSRSLVTFASKRVRRIFPAFWVCLAVTAFALAPCMWVLRGRDLSAFPWMGPEGAASYVWRNALLAIHQHSIGPVLDGAAVTGALNGSLWSLAPEFGCYILLTVLGCCGVLRGARWLLLVVTALTLGFAAMDLTGGRASFPAVPALFAFSNLDGLIAAFLVGMCAHAFREELVFEPATVVGLAVIITAVAAYGGFRLAAPVLVPLFLLMGGSLFACRLRTDLSYGIYIYSFPLQQILAAGGWLDLSVMAFFAVSFILSAAFALASWHGVEKRALHRS